MGLFGNRGNGEHKGGRLKQAFETAKPALNLSQQQENQITAIFKDFSEERRELKGSGGDDSKEAIRAARKEAKQKIMAVLSDDQKRILEEHMSQWKDQAD